MSKLKTIATLETLPHKFQRYETCGDWRVNGSGNIEVFVSEMGDSDSEFCVAVHELIESYLCRKHGITDEVVTAFDKDFEAKRMEGNTDEPGDSPGSPYRQQHRTATLIEMLVADALGLEWKRHEANVNKLFENKS